MQREGNTALESSLQSTTLSYRHLYSCFKRSFCPYGGVRFCFAITKTSITSGKGEKEKKKQQHGFLSQDRLFKSK